MLANGFGCVDPIKMSVQIDVHQDQVGLQDLHFSDRLLSADACARDVVTGVLKLAFQE